MARLPSPNKIKTHQVYTVWEAAQALGRHRQTVIRWVKNDGLIADRTRVPWLIRGEDLKQFLGHRRAKSKTKMVCISSKASDADVHRNRTASLPNTLKRRRRLGCSGRSVQPAVVSSTKSFAGAILKQFAPKSRWQCNRLTQE